MLIRLRRIGPEVDREFRFDAQEVAPFHRPVIGKLWPLQQLINQLPAFVFQVGILDELARLLGSVPMTSR